MSINKVPLSHFGFFLLTNSECSVNLVWECVSIKWRVNVRMGDEEETTTIDLLKAMQQQMVSLQSKVDEMQQKQHTTAMDHEAVEEGDGSGNLIELSETTKSFLEAAFSATVANTDRKKQLDRIGVPDCDAIRCPKLDQVMQSTILNDAIKADGYLSCLQQF